MKKLIMKKLIGMYDSSVPESLEFNEDGTVSAIHFLKPLNDNERSEIVQMLMKQQEEKKKQSIKKLTP